MLCYVMTNETYNGKNVIWESKTKQIILVLISFLFTFASLWIGEYEKVQFWFAIVIFGFGGIFILVRLLNPKNIFVTYKSKIGKEILAERIEFEQNDFGIFEYNENGFKISIEKTIEKYKWSEINTVYGYKIDLITYDEICIDFLTIDQNKYTITESTSGWFQFISRLSENIKSIEIDWYLKIANPAFEKNLTLLYDKQNRKIEEIRNENIIDKKHNS
jgi:hypothetical protein